MSEGFYEFPARDRVPFCVPEGWGRSVYVKNLSGPSSRILFYANGDRRFEHRCDRGDRGTIACAPLLQAGHVETQADPLTIDGSVLCPDCGTHGYIRNSRWSDA